MKKLFLFLAMASTTLFVSCGSDDSDNNNGGEQTATSITLTAAPATVEVGQAVTFTVTNNLNANVTSASTFTANNVPFTGPTFTPTAAGSYSVVATNGVLVSAAVVVTVTEPAATAGDNSIFVNGENNTVNNSILVFFGGYAEDPNATEATHGLFSMITFDDETADVIYDTTTANNYIDVEFIVPVDAEGALVFPTSTNSQFLDIFEVWTAGTEVTLTSQEGGSLTLADFPDAINMPHAFSATADYNAGSELEVNFDGNWLGFLDATAGRSTLVKSKNVSKLSNKVLSRSEVLKNKAKFFASFKK